MQHNAEDILAVLDACCDACTFPMLDNGYLYLAATRLSLFRSPVDWALVIEVFGYSPRAGHPDTHIHTFSSNLYDRDSPDKYVTRQAYENYLAHHQHNESRYVYPVERGDWQDADYDELVALDATEVLIRGRQVPIPSTATFAEHGIHPETPGRIRVFELCRYLAAVARDDVLATDKEQRVSVRPEMERLMQLDEWHHPNVVDDADRPSGSPTFRQLAAVLEIGDVGLYQPADAPNTHWRHWPDGGTL